MFHASLSSRAILSLRRLEQQQHIYFQQSHVENMMISGQYIAQNVNFKNLQHRFKGPGGDLFSSGICEVETRESSGSSFESATFSFLSSSESYCVVVVVVVISVLLLPDKNIERCRLRNDFNVPCT